MEISVLIENIKGILMILSIIGSFIVSLKKSSFGKGKILKGKDLHGKYLNYKTIREEYSKDKNNGYFLLQQYFKRCLPLDEMEHILNSSDAYKAFSFSNAGREKCEFKDNKYTLKDTKKSFVLWCIGYFISFLLIAGNIVYADYILKEICLYDFFVISIFNLCISVPFFITCVMSLDEINCAKRLAGSTNKEKGQRKKCLSLFGNKRLRTEETKR